MAKIKAEEIDWIEKLKALAAADELEDDSLNPAFLLEIDEQEVQFLASAEDKTLSEDQLKKKQAVEDIRVLEILFQTVANSTVSTLQKTQDQMSSLDKNLKTETTGLLQYKKDKERLEKQIISLEEIAEGSGIDFSVELNNLKSELAKVENKNKENRNTVKSLHQSKKDLQKEITNLKKIMGGARGEQLILALKELKRIRDNRCVSKATLSEDRGQLWLEVKLHPVVIEDQGINYYVEALHFRIAITSKSELRIKWIFDSSEPATAWSPHPHIFPGRQNEGSACWGDAWGPIKDALGRHELSTAIRYITGWASQCRDDSHRNALRENFLKTDLEPGWHPEIDSWPGY